MSETTAKSDRLTSLHWHKERLLRDSWILAPLRDRFVFPIHLPRPNFFALAWHTLRYRLAGCGIAISDNERRLLALKDKHAGGHCFILGNGPSLNQCDLTRLKDEITFASNNIYMNRERMGFDPTYYVIQDIHVARDRKDEINAYKGPTKLMGRYLRSLFDDGPDTIWTNVSFQPFDHEREYPRFSTNAARRIWTGGTVSYDCLHWAYYMGFTTVYLIGFDHKWTIPKHSDVEGETITSGGDDPNHFAAGYFGKGYRWYNPRPERMAKSLEKGRIAFDADGRKVLNATVGGHLEVFERVDYDSLFD